MYRLLLLALVLPFVGAADLGRASSSDFVPSARPAAAPARGDPPIAFVSYPSNDEHDDASWVGVVNTDGSHFRRLTPRYGEAGAPAWSPDGRRIAYADWLRINVMDRNGRHRRLLVKGEDGAPRWSPNGRQLVYAEGVGLKELKIVDLATRRIRTLHTDPVIPGGADWSPDGRKLVFAGVESEEDLGDNGEIYVIGRNGKGLRKLIGAPPGVDLAAQGWSPDGKRFLYSWHRNSTTFLYLARADGSRGKRLIRVGADVVASWSWDGTRIAFGVTDIRLLNLRSGAVRKIDLPWCRRVTCQGLDWSRRR
jgi:Tol biopolymer transport system component